MPAAKNLPGINEVKAFLRSTAFNLRKNPEMKAIWDMNSPDYHQMRAIEHIRTLQGSLTAQSSTRNDRLRKEADFKELAGAVRQLVIWWFRTHGKKTA